MQSLKILEDFPFAYKLIRKTKNFEYRKLIIKNYIIIYKINLKEKEINILHIYNQKQKIKDKKEYSQRYKDTDFCLYKKYTYTLNVYMYILNIIEQYLSFHLQ